jgi:hypothetical protein
VLETWPRKEKKDWRSGYDQPNQHQPSTPDCLVCTGQCPVPRLARRRSGCSRESAGRRGYKSPDCPLVHRTVRWANGARGQRSPTRSTGDTWPSQRSDGHTGQCPVHQRARKTNGRLRPIWKEIEHQTGTVHVRWCTGLSGAPLDRRQDLPSKLISNDS